MTRLKRNPHSFKLGMLTGITFMLTIDNAVNLFSDDGFSLTRFIMVILFGVVSLAFGLKAYKKI